MKSYWIKPDYTVEIKETAGEPSWEDMKEFVGGYLEHVSVLFDNRPCSMFVNEEGALIPLEENIIATQVYYAASRARGVDPANDAEREADQLAQLEKLAEGLGVPKENIKTFSLGPPGAPKIYGPVILFDRPAR